MVELMNRVYFEISDYPKLSDYILRVHRMHCVSSALIEMGYKSAGFDHKLDTWFIDEHEFTWMVLMWS